MATHTTYYNLTKPSANDKVNIGVLNDNTDIIDTALHNKVDLDDLTAENVMMSDGVTSVEDRLDAHTLGTTVNITSYDSSSNMYTFPSDGYVTISATAASSKMIFQIPEGPAISAIYNTQNAWNAVFVKKGMSGYVYSKSGTVNAYFKPLTD